MKQNALGESILQPDDDIFAEFSEVYGANLEDTLTAFEISNEDQADLGWTCSIRDEGLNEMQAHNFGTRDELVAWLTHQNVQIET